jgi:hypothetical protein
VKSLHKNLNNELQFRKSFYTRTLYAGKFNRILMGVSIGLQKPSFTSENFVSRNFLSRGHVPT